jgi:formate/nitrite transporter FocA (FNT family)
MLSKARNFAHHVVPAVIKPLRVLWNEMIGFVYLAFGAVVTIRVWKEHENGQSPGMVVMGSGFALVLIYFGVTSFWKARKINRT